MGEALAWARRAYPEFLSGKRVGVHQGKLMTVR